MFSLAYVLLPFTEVSPAGAIRSSLARFQRGLRGDVPAEWLEFEDETGSLKRAHETRFTFTDKGAGGIQIEGGHHAFWYLETATIRREMRERGQERWTVRFADLIDLDSFFDLYGRDLERHPDRGAYGRWLNPLGQWDWWDLGGRFDGQIMGERYPSDTRKSAAISSGDNAGRSILTNVEHALRGALAQATPETVDVRTDRNIELASTLLKDARAGLDHAVPAALVLPPDTVPDHLRWLRSWPETGPVEAFGWLGLDRTASWDQVVEAAYARFEEHWVAGVAYHH